MKTLTITWRDEAYGQHSYSAAAFRLYDTVDLSDAAMEKIQRAAKRAGFELCRSRCSYIADTIDAALRFVAEVEKLGYLPEHGGTWPSGPPAVS